MPRDLKFHNEKFAFCILISISCIIERKNCAWHGKVVFMADREIPFPEGIGPKAKRERTNFKADIFEKYMKEQGLNFFVRQDHEDSFDTTVFITALPAGQNHKVAATVITNNSMYVVVRVHLGLAPKGPARKTFLNFLNELNGHHAIVKYLIAEDDNVFIDVCTTARAEKFDPEVVRTLLDMVVFHLNEKYDDVARRLDKTSDQMDGFDL